MDRLERLITKRNEMANGLGNSMLWIELFYFIIRFYHLKNSDMGIKFIKWVTNLTSRIVKIHTQIDLFIYILINTLYLPQNKRKKSLVINNKYKSLFLILSIKTNDWITNVKISSCFIYSIMSKRNLSYVFFSNVQTHKFILLIQNDYLT